MTTWRVQVRDPRGALHDVFASGDRESTTESLVEQIEALGFHARPLGLHARSLNQLSSTLADAGLENGDVITVGRLDPDPPLPRHGWYVISVSGPDAGRWARLDPGRPLTVGRTGCRDLALDDPLLSAAHCRISLVGDEVTIIDAGSTNGTYVEGEPIDGRDQPTVLDPGQYVQVGSSVLTVIEITADDLAVLGDADGPDRVFPRQYRRALPALPERLEAPRTREVEESTSAATWWRSAVPLVTGAGFALLTGRWIFLLIMAVAPIIFTVDAMRRRRRVNSKTARQQQKYAEELLDFRTRLAALRRVERGRLRDAARVGGLSSISAEARLSNLWERSPADDDFLALTVGLAAMPSAITISDSTLDDNSLQWGTPVGTDLRTTGSLAVIGEPARTMGVARSLVMSLAAHHSPADLRISILTADTAGDQWGFARWLPHTFQADHGCRIATDNDSRAALLSSITQLLETRREVTAGTTGGSRAQHAPVHLVVVDDTSLLSPGELTELLVGGPANGIVAITLDARLAPEGSGATLTLATASDTCVFQSRHQPRVEGVAVAEMSADVATAAALRLAGLRPTTSEERDLAGGVVHLVDILDGGPTVLDGDHVRERWASIGPRTEVTVGMAANTPMKVDLVRDGPHGLVGGTSGSGKTEFLKTLFCALALNNHPDDLSIVIVDFKGGVDHEAVKPLPHVIDVATNLDIEQFKRTIVLLKAESRRRQDLLGGAGASNIDSYRMARANRPDLPRLPRLLVVVDEFGELLASEGGREQLKELESITRIGRALGLHLLLVTQNFDGNLPPQIDANAGMRVCLRVQKPVHSKAVLDSGIAATISDRNVGRAYARFHGRDLIEFQTARVAGRRRDLAATSSPVSARLVPFSVLSTPPPASRPEDVPVEETDMYLLLESIREAAAATGWTRSSVPWPSSLPEHVSLLSIARRSTGPSAPIGIADVPAEQRRDLVTISERDQQLALIGGPNTPLGDLLATYATSLAVANTVDDLHIYAIDLVGRGLAMLTDLPHCGGVAVRNEALALRMVRWLMQEAAERKVAIAESGSSTVWEHAATGAALPPQIVLLVSGAERLLSTNDGPVSNLLGPLTSLMSEAVGTRIQVVLAGLPKVVAHRLGMNIERRFVFQLADPGEYSGLNVPKSAAPDLRIERRAMEVGTGRIVQFAQLAEPGGSGGGVIRKLGAEMPPPRHRPPRRFADVTWPLPWIQAPLDRLHAPAHLAVGLPVGLSTDDGDWLWVDADDDGPVFAVVGPPKSGRSSALAAIARLAKLQGHGVLNVGLSRRSPLATSTDAALGVRAEPGCVAAALERMPGRVVVLLDDLQRLVDPTPIEAALTHRDRVLLVVAGPPDLLSSRTGVLRGLPNATSGMLLAPTGSLDGSAIGLRRLAPEWTSNSRAGRGILAVAGEATEIQVPDVSLSR